MVTAIGFSGSRNGASSLQQHWLAQCFTFYKVDEWHHGACIGADEFSHKLAIAWNVRLSCTIYVHPPLNTRLMMSTEHFAHPNVVVLPAKDYLPRDRDIVDASERLLATPDGPRKPHSGTWYTVDYAVSQNKPVAICYPDGKVEVL